MAIPEENYGVTEILKQLKTQKIESLRSKLESMDQVTEYQYLNQTVHQDLLSESENIIGSNCKLNHSSS